MRWLLPVTLIMFFSCHRYHVLSVPERRSGLTGSLFYKTAGSFNWQQRDSFVVKEILSGNLPSFLKKFQAVNVHIINPESGKTIRASFYVAPDYLSVGTNADWARIHITPHAAQKIADTLDCFLPTKKMVDDIYQAAKVKLEPVPLYAFRDSTPTMYHHHLIVEGQRQGRKGLIAGIQKDVVISDRVSRDPRPGRVAIYGWHQPGGQPIQPLYAGHVFSWVDYSQGIRLVYRKMRVQGKWMDYTEVMKDPLLRKLICDEEYCDFYKYPY